jgi:hypothetical protein
MTGETERIHNNLNRAQECRLFIDINTKQRPVPNELLLDIKRLAETETDDEALLTDVFNFFVNEPDSPLVGLLSPSTRARGKLSRVTFNAALGAVQGVFAQPEPRDLYGVLAAYLRVWGEHLQKLGKPELLVNPIVFRGILLLFPDVAQRVSDRYGKDYSTESFREMLGPMLARVKKARLERPGHSHVALHKDLQDLLRKQFTIGI